MRSGALPRRHLPRDSRHLPGGNAGGLPGGSRWHGDCRRLARATVRAPGATRPHTDRPEMPPLWIVHRDPHHRAALLRLAAADDAVAGAPGDPRFDAAAPPRVVLLGIGGDFEAELEFARRSLRRLRESAWILLLEPKLIEDARRLFDAIS